MTSVYWLLLLTGLAAYVQGKIYSRWALRKLSYKRYFNVSACFQGEEVQLVEEIANRKALPLPWLRLESLFHSGLRFHSQANLRISLGDLYQHHRSLFTLMPYTRIKRRHRIHCLKRGYYDLHSATLTTGDLLGMHAMFETLKFDRSARLLVYPLPIAMESIPLPSHSWMGDVSVRRWVMEDPFRIAGVREYRYGDPMNQVSWSATARTGKLQVYQREYTADHRVMIYVNFETSEKMWRDVTEPDRIEKGIAYAAALARRCIAQGIDTGFGCNGYLAEGPKEPVRVAPSGGDAHLTGLYETMAMLVVGLSGGFVDFLEADIHQRTRNTDFVIITSYVNEAIERQLTRLRQNGNAVLVIPLTSDPMPSTEETNAPLEPNEGA